MTAARGELVRRNREEPRHRTEAAGTGNAEAKGRAAAVPTGDEWSIACRDLAGRRTTVTVLVSTDKVVLVAPPGEAAVLGPLDVGRLRAALRDAVVAVSQNPAYDA